MERLRTEVIFGSGHPDNDLARRSVWGGIATLTSQGVQLVLRLVGTVVLARLLTPVDYGLMGMVTAVVNLAEVFKDAGLSMATVQKDRISHEQTSTLFWLNVLISAFLGLCVLAGSPLVASLYGRPELTAVTATLAMSFVVSGLAIQHQALLRRHMRFGELAGIQIVSQAVTLVVTIVLACLGWRYWALVGGTLAQALVGTLLTIYFCPWVPGGLKRGTGVRAMVGFGGYLTGFNLVNYFARNADNILIGKFIGVGVLGLYAKAYDLFMMPISQIRTPMMNVAMPALSAIKDQPERYRKYYQRIIHIMASLTMPVALYCAIEADVLIEAMLGPQWLGAAPLLRIMAIAGVIQPTIGTVGVVLCSLGQAQRYFIMGTTNSLFIVGSFALGLPWGAMGVATSYTIVTYVLLLPTLWYSFRRSPISVTDYFLAMSRPAVASIIMGSALLLVRPPLASVPGVASVACSLIIGVLVYLSALFTIPGGPRLLREYSSYWSLLSQRNT